MRSSFDDELRERLRSYREKPRRDLWESIAQQITPVEPMALWRIWLSRARGIVLILALLILSHQVTHYGTEPADKIRFDSEPFPEQHDLIAGNRIGAVDSLRIDGDPCKNLEPTDNVDSVAIEFNPQQQRASNRGNSTFQKGSAPPALVSTVSVPPESLHEVATLMMPPTEIAIRNFRIQGTTIVSARPSISERIVNGKIQPDIADPRGSTSSEIESRYPSRYSIYLTAMPIFGYQRIEANRHDVAYVESIKRISAFSTDRLGIRVETGIEIPFSRRISGFAGILFFQRDQTIEYTERQLAKINVQASDATTQYEGEFRYLRKTFEHELKNIGMQFGITYSLNAYSKREIFTPQKLSFRARKTKFSHVVGTGLEFHKSLKPSPSFLAKTAFNDPSVYVFLNAYYRLQYPLGVRLNAIFQPTFNYSVYLHEDLNAPLYLKPFGLGLNLGFTYGF